MSRAHDLETIRAFLSDLIGVLHDAAGVTATFDARSLRVAPSPDPRPSRSADPGHGCAAALAAPEIAVIIHVHGDLSGVTWTFPTEIVRRAAIQMVPGIDPDAAVCEAAAAELANTLTGRGLPALAARGIHIEIEPPQITAAARPGIGGRLATELGPVDVVFHARGSVP